MHPLIKPRILTLLAASIIISPASEPQPQVSFTEGAANTWNADWLGTDGRTYFLQWNTDLTNWQYGPVIEFGTGIKSFGIDTLGEPKFFIRLVYRDDPSVTTLQEAREADFDYDGIPNWFEVEILGTDPLDGDSAGGDSDADGLPDGWELYWFGNLDQDAQDINPHTGLTHAQSHAEGRNPNIAAIADGDGSHVQLTVFTPFD